MPAGQQGRSSTVGATGPSSSLMLSLQRFYGYKHWTLEEMPRCFYVGKGLKNRHHSFGDRNHKWHAIVKRYGLRVEVCIGPVTNEEACVWEIENISKEKTYCPGHEHHDHDTNDTGCNFTKGGDGISGWQHSSKTRALWSLKRKGIKPTPETNLKNSVANSGERNHMFGKHHTPESNAKNKLSNQGKIPWNKGVLTPLNVRLKQSKSAQSRARPSIETCVKMSESRKGKKRGPYKKRIK